MRFNSKTIVGFVALVLLPGYAFCQNTLRPLKRFTEYLDAEVASSFSQVDADGNCSVDVEALTSGWQVKSTGFWNAITSADITCYGDPHDQGGHIASIPFGTELAVIELQGAWMKVRFDGKNAVMEGWVEPCGILLWSKPLARNGGFPKRRVVLSQLEGTNVQATVEQRYFSGPSRRAQQKFAVNGQDVLYVMKEAMGPQDQEPWSLLCSTANSNDLVVDLMGWLPNSSLTDWDTRVAYWENNSAGSVKEYGNKPIPLFYTKPALREFENSGYTRLRDTLQAPVLLEKQDPLNRMLHLEASSSETTNDLELFSVVLPKKSPSGLKPDEVENIKEFYLNRMKTLQIHFVIDATKSMDKNKDAVISGLNRFWTEITNNQLKAFTETQVKVGCSVYRDALDDEGLGDPEFDRTKGAYYKIVAPTLIDSENALGDFTETLDSISFVSSPRDRSLEEAFYHGIVKSIKDADFKAGATNYLIVIGDAGDAGDVVRKQKLNKEQVLEVIQEAGVDVCFLQSTNGYHVAFDQFTADAMYWTSMLDSADGPLESIKDVHGQAGWRLIQPTRGREGHVFLKKAQVYMNSDVKKVMEKEILGELVSKEITGAMRLANKRRLSWIDAGKGGPVLPPGFFVVGPRGDTLRAADLDLRGRSVRVFGKKNYYNLNDVEANNRSAFKPYVYLEYEVLTDLQREIKKLNGKNGQKFFVQLEKFMKKYAAEVLGVGSAATSAAIGNLTMGEVWSEAFNVPFKYNQLATKKLKELSQLDSGASKELAGEIKKFKQACSDFVGVDVSMYRFTTSLDSNNEGGVVYWIPGDQFPGMAK